MSTSSESSLSLPFLIFYSILILHLFLHLILHLFLSLSYFLSYFLSLFFGAASCCELLSLEAVLLATHLRSSEPDEVGLLGLGAWGKPGDRERDLREIRRRSGDLRKTQRRKRGSVPQRIFFAQ